MSFILTLLYIIVTFIRPQDWVPAFYDKPIIQILVVGALGCLILEKMAISKSGFAKVPQNRLMLGLYAAIILSHVVHTYFMGAVAAFTSFSVIFLLFFLTLNGINTSGKFKTAFWLIVFLIVILVFQGMYQIVHGYGWAGQGLTVQGGQFRINWVGIFYDPNDLALTFVIAAGMLLPFTLGKSNFIQRNISFGCMGLLFYGIYLTNSRGGLLALMATVFFYFVRKTRKFVVGGAIGGLLAFAIFSFGPSRAGLMSAEEASAMERVELWYQGILMMKSNPLFGVGFNMFTDRLGQTAHNSFILAGAELGFLGLFLWMALFYSSFKGLSIIQTEAPAYYNYALGLQSSLIGFCAAAFFLSRTYIILPYILFALSGALIHIVAQNNKTLDFRFTRQDTKITSLLSIGIILLSYLVIKISL